MSVQLLNEKLERPIETPRDAYVSSGTGDGSIRDVGSQFSDAEYKFLEALEI
jgi:hypothetical protein